MTLQEQTPDDALKCSGGRHRIKREIGRNSPGRSRQAKSIAPGQRKFAVWKGPRFVHICYFVADFLRAVTATSACVQDREALLHRDEDRQTRRGRACAHGHARDVRETTLSRANR